ncbi:CCR4-NOT transcription complex subunit 4 [Porphyridium purpureum]|uniref:CCR4-NOT transcription complex subunit 4 n=1 Tax=Porphyridium purpureum TaxID=35688 RepID=A0A5J4YM21_PORPP|nr:CCR4-NOT transcription complex subunit 4 [Porphyridium purpureum]|eukprot:POR3213..scf249_10
MERFEEDEDGVPECPLCLEELDTTDLSLKPCHCGYQVCLWCLHHIREQLNGKCPACRTPYAEEKFVKAEIDPEDAKRAARERAEAKRERERKVRLQRLEKEREEASAQAQALPKLILKQARILCKSLVYVNGLSPTLAREEVLRRHELFGRFGTIELVLLNHRSSALRASNNGPGGPSMSAYIKFVKDTDAAHAVRAVNGEIMDGRELRCAIATTKYCDSFIETNCAENGDSGLLVPCELENCLYLHALAEPEIVISSAEDMLVTQLGPPPPGHLFPRLPSAQPVAESHQMGKIVSNAEKAVRSARQSSTGKPRSVAGPSLSVSLNTQRQQHSAGVSSTSLVPLDQLAPHQNGVHASGAFSDTSRSISGGSAILFPSGSVSVSSAGAGTGAGAGVSTFSSSLYPESTTTAFSADSPPKHNKVYPPGYVDPFDEEKPPALASVSVSLRSVGATISSTANSSGSYSGLYGSANETMRTKGSQDSSVAPDRAFSASPIVPPPGFETFKMNGSLAQKGDSIPPPRSGGVPGTESGAESDHSSQERAATGGTHTQVLPDVSAEIQEILMGLNGTVQSLSLGERQESQPPGITPAVGMTHTTDAAAPAMAAAVQMQMQMPPLMTAEHAYPYTSREYSRFGFARGGSGVPSVDSRTVEYQSSAGPAAKAVTAATVAPGQHALPESFYGVSMYESSSQNQNASSSILSMILGANQNHKAAAPVSHVVSAAELESNISRYSRNMNVNAAPEASAKLPVQPSLQQPINMMPPGFTPFAAATHAQGMPNGGGWAALDSVLMRGRNASSGITDGGSVIGEAAGASSSGGSTGQPPASGEFGAGVANHSSPFLHHSYRATSSNAYASSEYMAWP